MAVEFMYSNNRNGAAAGAATCKSLFQVKVSENFIMETEATEEFGTKK